MLRLRLRRGRGGTGGLALPRFLPDRRRLRRRGRLPVCPRAFRARLRPLHSSHRLTCCSLPALPASLLPAARLLPLSTARCAAVPPLPAPGQGCCHGGPQRGTERAHAHALGSPWRSVAHDPSCCLPACRAASICCAAAAPAYRPAALLPAFPPPAALPAFHRVATDPAHAVCLLLPSCRVPVYLPPAVEAWAVLAADSRPRHGLPAPCPACSAAALPAAWGRAALPLLTAAVLLLSCCLGPCCCPGWPSACLLPPAVLPASRPAPAAAVPTARHPRPSHHPPVARGHIPP